MSPTRPLNLVAELTYRCPLRCPYCSNPTDLGKNTDSLTASDWERVFEEAAALGVVHVGLTGGEPSTRTDLETIVQSAASAGLYTHLVTAGIPLGPKGVPGLLAAGLRSVQLSLQDSLADASNRIAGTVCFEEKLAFAREVRHLGLPLILNVVLHRHNLDRVGSLIELARELDAERLELANVQYHGWARLNGSALLPSRKQIEAAAERVAQERRHGARPEILFVLPDFFRDRPKPCMGGWGEKTMVVAPDGTALPCHEAQTLKGLEFWNVKDRSLRECWEMAPGMNAFRGQEWMPEPCRSCPERARDFGGCRCQAFHLTGNAAATDPACALSPEHARVALQFETSDQPFVYREARKS